MIALMWEYLGEEGPDGQTQDGICAYFDDQALAEQVLLEATNSLPDFRFNLLPDYELLINPTAEQVIKGFLE